MYIKIHPTRNRMRWSPQSTQSLLESQSLSNQRDRLYNIYSVGY